MTSFDEEDMDIAELLIGNIGDSGYIQGDILEESPFSERGGRASRMGP